MDWPQRILFFIGTVSALFAVATLAGFSMQWWWSREVAFIAVMSICLLLMRHRLVMLAAIGLVVASRAVIAAIVFLVAWGHKAR